MRSLILPLILLTAVLTVDRHLMTSPFGELEIAVVQAGGSEPGITRKQLGEMLGYENPAKAIKDIHTRNAARFDGGAFCALIKLPDSMGREVETYIYSFKGILEICRYSNQPNIHAVMDWGWDVLDRLRRGEPSGCLGELEVAVVQADGSEPGVTRQQLGEMLEYTNPADAIAKIHLRNKDRLDRLSTTSKMEGVDGKLRDIVIYGFKGVLEVCSYSNQPKALAVRDWAWDVLDRLRRGELVRLPWGVGYSRVTS